ncbi:MAG: Fe-S cluster assembly protein SufB, partial [Gammaproteobacteria bacterium]|nr:Fe-S cluster assembly protein SufB [Gammaproteobacteria bacterium]
MNQTQQQVEQLIQSRYKAGFYTDIESETVGAGLNEEVIAMISARKSEPAWMLEWRLKAYHHWLGMTPPNWAKLSIPAIDF